MPEVTTEDSISRRGSYQNNNRPNSHVQHAAAVAAANPGNTAAISGPRPPPSSIKEARPWAFTTFDNRTKTQLAASVDEASYASDMRARVGGPRPLADSAIAIKRGVLAPPVCSNPKVQRLPDRKLQKRTTEDKSRYGESSAAAGAWTRDWSTLKADTGYSTPANSSVDVTPISTPRVPLGVPLFSSRIASRMGALSPVVELSEKRSSGGSSGNTTNNSSSDPRPATAPPPATAAAPAPPPRVWTTTASQHSATAPPAGPRSPSFAEPPRVSTARYGRTLSYDNTGAPVSPPPPMVQTATATTVPAPTAARTPATRVRLVRAQAQAQEDRPAYTTASLRRPPRLTEVRTTVTTSEVRSPEDDRLFFVNPAPPPRPASNNSGITNLVRCPGSWRESWREP